MSDEIDVVQFSGGAVSFLAAERIAEKKGTTNLVLLFADTLIEDEDTYRFLDDAGRHFGVPVTVIQDGRDPWQVFHDERMLGNTRFDPCSKILKRSLLDKWKREHYEQATTVLHVGMLWDEGDRLDVVRARLAPWRVEAPMYDPPYLSKNQCIDAVRAAGVEPRRLYAMGFPHNNCGGFCVKAGQSQFALLLKTMPERYAYHEGKEQEFREFIGRDVSILRDRRGGTMKPLTMKEFRERQEAGEQADMFSWGACECGV